MTEESLMVISDITEEDVIKAISKAVEEGKNYALEIALLKTIQSEYDILPILKDLAQQAAAKAVETYMKETGQL